MNVHLRQHIRTTLNCQIKITHPDIEDIIATTEDLSDTGVFIAHPEMTKLVIGDVVFGQVQGLSDSNDAPVLMMEVVRITSKGAGLRFIQE